jgi:hypothetical protein
MTMCDLFDATVHKGIAKGSCVMIYDSSIVYAGPLNHAARPDADGKVILLHPEDFAQLKSHVDARRH